MACFCFGGYWLPPRALLRKRDRPERRGKWRQGAGSGVLPGRLRAAVPGEGRSKGRCEHVPWWKWRSFVYGSEEARLRAVLIGEADDVDAGVGGVERKGARRLVLRRVDVFAIGTRHLNSRVHGGGSGAGRTRPSFSCEISATREAEHTVVGYRWALRPAAEAAACCQTTRVRGRTVTSRSSNPPDMTLHSPAMRSLDLAGSSKHCFCPAPTEKPKPWPPAGRTSSSAHEKRRIG
eukprot:scaffold26267_cov109-Isochrysis_galbana.AAC.1